MRMHLILLAARIWKTGRRFDYAACNGGGIIDDDALSVGASTLREIEESRLTGWLFDYSAGLPPNDSSAASPWNERTEHGRDIPPIDIRAAAHRSSTQRIHFIWFTLENDARMTPRESESRDNCHKPFDNNYFRQNYTTWNLSKIESFRGVSKAKRSFSEVLRTGLPPARRILPADVVIPAPDF